MKCMFRYPIKDDLGRRDYRLPSDYDFECSERALPNLHFCKTHAEQLGYVKTCEKLVDTPLEGIAGK